MTGIIGVYNCSSCLFSLPRGNWGFLKILLLKYSLVPRILRATIGMDSVAYIKFGIIWICVHVTFSYVFEYESTILSHLFIFLLLYSMPVSTVWRVLTNVLFLPLSLSLSLPLSQRESFSMKRMDLPVCVTNKNEMARIFLNDNCYYRRKYRTIRAHTLLIGV